MTSPSTILVIENDPDIREVLEEFLRDEGYVVHGADHGRAALETIARHGIPALILLDMKMPVMNGWEFAAAFRERFGNAAPIVVMSATVDLEQRAKDIAATAALGKPFALEDVDRLLKSLLG